MTDSAGAACAPRPAPGRMSAGLAGSRARSHHLPEAANPAFFEAVGGDRAQLGEPIAELLPERTAQGVLDRLDAVHAPASPTGPEADGCCRRTGQPARGVLRLTYGPRHDEIGRIDGTVVTAVETTAHHVAVGTTQTTAAPLGEAVTAAVTASAGNATPDDRPRSWPPPEGQGTGTAPPRRHARRGEPLPRHRPVRDEQVLGPRPVHRPHPPRHAHHRQGKQVDRGRLRALRRRLVLVTVRGNTPQKVTFDLSRFRAVGSVIRRRVSRTPRSVLGSCDQTVMTADSHTACRFRVRSRRGEKSRSETASLRMHSSAGGTA